MASTLQERARILVNELAQDGVDQVNIASAAGVTKGTVNQWLTGAIKSVKLEYALGIERKFQYNHRWLVMGEEPKKLALNPSATEPVSQEVWDTDTVELHGGDSSRSAYADWPLRICTPDRFFALDKEQRLRADVMINGILEGFEMDRKSAADKRHGKRSA